MPKITALPANSGLVAADLIPVVDDPAGTAATQKATLTQLLAFIDANASITESQISDLQTYLTSVATTDLDSPTGSDTNIVTGTKPAGSAVNLAGWDANGDVIDSGLTTANMAENLGLQTIVMPAVAMNAAATSGATAATYNPGGGEAVPVFTFDGAANEVVNFHIPIPKSWDNTTNLKFYPLWTCEAGSGTVIWIMRSVSVGDNESITSLTYGDDDTSTDTIQTVEYLHIGPTSSGKAPAGAGQSEWLFFEVERDASTDTSTNDAHLFGVVILYEVNAGTDD